MASASSLRSTLSVAFTWVKRIAFLFLLGSYPGTFARSCRNPPVGGLVMFFRSLVLVAAVLGVVAVLSGCGEDDSTATPTPTSTTTATESQPPTPTGPAVAVLQQVMTRLGYYDGPIDGVYGDETTAAVKEMQTELGVTADGIYGPETQAALKDRASAITAQIQTVLATYGYYDGEIDGTYGAETVAAVKELQTDLGVAADGRFGPETAAAFDEAVASGELTPA
jgi:peptidoglycan hydrolase-like protein with peptidoglycan-binding domain